MRGIKFVAGLALALSVSVTANASVTDDYAAQYKAGTLFPNDTKLDNWRNNTSDREMTFEVIREVEVELEEEGVRRVEGRVYAYFHEAARLNGEAQTAYGVMMIQHDGGRLLGSEWVLFKNGTPGRRSQAAVGQLADLATTGIGMGLGFGEANPLGILIMPVKLISYHYARSAPLLGCVEGMKSLARFGWGAAGFNIGVMAFGLPGAIVGALIGAVVSIDDEEAAMECAKP